MHAIVVRRHGKPHPERHRKRYVGFGTVLVYQAVLVVVQLIVGILVRLAVLVLVHVVPQTGPEVEDRHPQAQGLEADVVQRTDVESHSGITVLLQLLTNHLDRAAEGETIREVPGVGQSDDHIARGKDLPGALRMKHRAHVHIPGGQCREGHPHTSPRAQIVRDPHRRKRNLRRPLDIGSQHRDSLQSSDAGGIPVEGGRIVGHRDERLPHRGRFRSDPQLEGMHSGRSHFAKPLRKCGTRRRKHAQNKEKTDLLHTQPPVGISDFGSSHEEREDALRTSLDFLRGSSCS